MQSVTKTTSLEFKGTGEWLDTVDLIEKYKNKPDQLQSLMSKTRTMTCPLRNVTLYEDVVFSSKIEDKQENTETRKRKFETAPKDANPKGKAKASKKGQPQEGKPVKLKAGDLKKLNKKKTQMNQAKLHLMEVLHNAEKVKRFLPAHMIPWANKQIDNLAKMEGTLECVLNDPVDVDMAAVLQEADDGLAKGNSALEKLKAQVDMAVEFSESDDKVEEAKGEESAPEEELPAQAKGEDAIPEEEDA